MRQRVFAVCRGLLQLKFLRWELVPENCGIIWCAAVKWQWRNPGARRRGRPVLWSVQYRHSGHSASEEPWDRTWGVFPFIQSCGIASTRNFHKCSRKWALSSRLLYQSTRLSWLISIDSLIPQNWLNWFSSFSKSFSWIGDWVNWLWGIGMIEWIELIQNITSEVYEIERFPKKSTK